MSLHVIVGAGPVGSSAARLLADRGEQARIVSRQGAGPDHPAVERVAADASHAATLSDLTRGAVAVYNCASPHYHRWPADWPPLAGALLHAAERNGATLVITSNLYGYGPVPGPITEQAPLQPRGLKGAVRVRMWHDALEAHKAGRIRTTEVRGSDYVGAGARSMLTEMIVPKVVRGERLTVPADLDAPHSWTYVGDVARLLVTVATDERAWGRPWHVPSAPPASVREVATRVAALASAPPPRLSSMSAPVLWLGGLVNRTTRELREVDYQFRRPLVLDSSAAGATFGLQPTPLDDSLRETVEAATVRAS